LEVLEGKSKKIFESFEGMLRLEILMNGISDDF